MDDQTSHAPIPAAPTDTPTSSGRPALRDRVLGWRGVAGVALASVILGGAGGAVLGAVSDGGDSRGPGGFGGFRGPGMMQNSQSSQGSSSQQGQLPPSTAPQQEEQNS